MAIARIWTGRTRRKDGEAYQRYMSEVALDGYAATPGNLGVLMLRRDLPGGELTEFTMVTLWRDRASIEAFAGEDVERAVFYPRDDEFLVERELGVRHYEVYGRTPSFG